MILTRTSSRMARVFDPATGRVTTQIIYQNDLGQWEALLNADGTIADFERQPARLKTALRAMQMIDRNYQPEPKP